jgi:hypothetical protein
MGPCETCEVLKQELALAHNRNEKLLNSIITKPEVPVEQGDTPQAIMPKYVPWSIKRMELEKADRLKAEELRRNFAKTEVEDLEKEVLLPVEPLN